MHQHEKDCNAERKRGSIDLFDAAPFIFPGAVCVFQYDAYQAYPSLLTMKLPILKKHCLNFPGAIETLHAAPSNVLIYSVGGKSFAYFKTSDPEKWRFSIRVSPEHFLELTDTPGVKPARYMGRFHWVTIVKIESFPEPYLMELLEWSYRKALSALSKKKQAEILAMKS